jgi:hypothetical protein
MKNLKKRQPRRARSIEAFVAIVQCKGGAMRAKQDRRATREAAAMFGKTLGVSIPSIILALRGIALRFSKQKETYLLSEPYWLDLAHPLLIVKEVMGA